MGTTLLLDTQLWDLVVDAGGSWAVASEPYALAQDVASALKLFQAEVYYDTLQGIPYFSDILGQWPPLSIVRADFEQAALTVPGVVSAQIFFTGFILRKLAGQAQITDINGGRQVVSF